MPYYYTDHLHRLTFESVSAHGCKKQSSFSYAFAQWQYDIYVDDLVYMSESYETWPKKKDTYSVEK